MRATIKKNVLKQMTAVLLAVCLLSGCGMADMEDMFQMEGDSDGVSGSEENIDREDGELEAAGNGADETFDRETYSRPSLLRTQTAAEEMAVPNTAPYSVEADLSNIDNLWQFYLNDEMSQKLVQNGFVVDGNTGRQ